MSRSRKTIVIVIVVLFLAGIAGLYIWNRLSQKISTTPKFAIMQVGIKEVGAESTTMECKMKILNTTPVKIEADGMEFELLIDSSRLASSTYSKKISIPKGDSLEFSVPVTIRQKNLQRIVRRNEREDRDSATYTFKTKITPILPIMGKRTFTLEKTKDLPALRELNVDVTRLKIVHFGLKKSKVDIGLAIRNKNSFAININNPEFGLNVDKKLKLKGDTREAIRIPAKGRENVNLEVDIATSDLPGLGWKMLFDKESTEYRFTLTGKIESKEKLLDGVALNFASEGSMLDIKNFRESLKD